MTGGPLVMSKWMGRRSVELVAVSAFATALVLAFLGAGGLWDPAESALVERLWAGDLDGTRPLDAAVTSTVMFSTSVFAARLGHAVIGIVTVLAVWFVAPHRARRFAVAALIASPAFLLGARSAAGGIVGVLPLVVSAWSFIDHLQGGRTTRLVVGIAGACVAALAVGIAACAVPLVAVLALAITTPALRRRAVTSLVAIAFATVASGVLCFALDAPLVPGEIAKTLAFDRGLGRVGLGLFPLVLALPVAFTSGTLDVERRAWLAFAVAWLVPVMLWPEDPWIALAPAGALAVVAGDAYAALTEEAEPLPALAVVLGAGAVVIARSFHLAPNELAAAHLGGELDLDETLGTFALLACAVHAGALAWAALGRHRSVALGVALAAALLVTVRGARLGTRMHGPGELVALAHQHALPLGAGLGTRDHALVFAGATIVELANVDALADHLTAPGCRAVLVADRELAALHRRARGRFFVLGEPRAGLVLATSCLVPGTADANPLVQALPEVLPAIGRPADGEWGEAVRLRAVEAPIQVTTRATEISIGLVFEIMKPLTARYGVLLRMHGCNEMFYGDAHLVGRRLAADALQPGDILVHRATIQLHDPKPCAYTLSVGWNVRRRLLPVTRGDSDESERIGIGTITVVPAPR